MYDVVQIVGALFILAAYVSTLAGGLSQRSWAYLVANVAGSALLTATAVTRTEWGFILLEGTWCVVSALTILRKARGAGNAHDDVAGLAPGGQ